MKIIKHGNVKNPTHRFECKKCGCIFEITHDEFKLNTYYTSYNCSGKEFIYYCPDCKSAIRYDI